MADVLAALVVFASKVKDDSGASDVIREAAGDLHAMVSKLISEAAPVAPVQEAPPAEPASPPAEG